MTLLLGGLLLAALALVFGRQPALARPGDLDESFNNGGTVTTDFGGVDEARGVWIDYDTYVVVGVSNAGTDRFMVALSRYTQDGQLDTGFGTAGRVTTPVGSGDAFGMAVVVRVDSKIVVTGYAGPDGDTNFALVRYNPDGSVDTSFGNNGVTITPVSQGNDIARDLNIDDEGRIIVAGTSGQRLVLARYSPDGILDTSFGQDGFVSVSLASLGITNVSDEGFELALQEDGTVIAVVANGRFQVVWYEEDSFDVRIDALLAPGLDRANGLYGIHGYLPNHVAIAGATRGQFAVGLYRYTGSTSARNPGFGNDGIAVTSFGRGESVARSLLVDDQRRIVAVGRAGDLATGDFAVARYQALPEPEPAPSPTPAPEPMPRQTPAPTPAPTAAPTPTPAPRPAAPANTRYVGSDANELVYIEFRTDANGLNVDGFFRTLEDIDCRNNRFIPAGAEVAFAGPINPNGTIFGSFTAGPALFTLDVRIEGSVARGTFTYANPTTGCDTGRIPVILRAR